MAAAILPRTSGGADAEGGESAGGRLVLVGDADFASNELVEAYRASPPLGWHTTEILEGCGLTEAEIAAYRAAAPDWSMFVGSGSHLQAALEMGAAGGIVAVGCFAAVTSAEVLAAFRAGDKPRAAAAQELLTPLNRDLPEAYIKMVQLH